MKFLLNAKTTQAGTNNGRRILDSCKSGTCEKVLVLFQASKMQTAPGNPEAVRENR